MGKVSDKTVLRDIGLYKHRLLNFFLDSDYLKDALMGDNYTDELWYGNEEDDSDMGIVYQQIFPYLYVDDVQTKKKTYLCFETKYFKSPSSTIKTMRIIIWVYCNKDIMKYSKRGFLGTRVDALADMVERTLHDATNIGIGRLELESVTNIFPNNKYYGHELVFSVSDFKVKEVKR